MGTADKDQVVAAEVIVSAWRDDEYRRALLADPAGVLRAAGVTLPDGVLVTALEETPSISHVVIPADVSGPEAEAIAAGIASLLPLAEDREVHLHQSTPNRRFLVLPISPQVTELSAEELDAVAGGMGGNGGAGLGGTGGNGGNAGTWGAGLDLLGGRGGNGGNGGLF